MFSRDEEKYYSKGYFDHAYTKILTELKKRAILQHFTDPKMMHSALLDGKPVAIIMADGFYVN